MIQIIQKHFQDYILDGSREKEDKAANHIVDPPHFSRIEGLSIYLNNYRSTLLKALIHIYPVCEKLTGKNFFQAMARQYSKNHLSQFFSLNDYGYDFAEFVLQFTPAASLPYLSDLTKLEWAIHRAQIGEDSLDFDQEKLARLLSYQNQEDFRFRLTPNATLLSSPYPIQRIWEVNQEEYRGEETVDLNEGGVNLLVWRKGLELQLDPLTETERGVLTMFQTEKSLAELVTRPRTEVLERLPTLLPQFFAKGYFVYENKM